MKTRLTSVDVFFQVRELDEKLKNARIDKIYQIGKKDIKIRFHSTGKGSSEMIITPNYFCLTSYPREVPEQPTPFAMQLRKNLSGAFLRHIRQHEFDRIVIFEAEKKDERYELIAELFSDGNIFLCKEGRIIGLLEWQQWKDRTLGVGKEYVYPPSAGNPFKIGFDDFARIIKNSKKNVASTIATDIGTGGIYAESICASAGVKKDAHIVSDTEIKLLFESFQGFIKSLKSPSPSIIVTEEDTDVVPIDVLLYKNSKKQGFESFNDAVDEFFSRRDAKKGMDEANREFEKKRSKIEKILEKQKEVLKDLEARAEDYKKAGDAIYQNYADIEELLKAVLSGKEKGMTEEEITKKLEDARKKGIKSAQIFRKLKGNEIIIDV